MITLKKRPLGSYAPNIQTGPMIYAYESTHQDATRTHQPTPDQLRRLWEEEQRRQESARIHAEPARQVAIAAAAGATGGRGRISRIAEPLSRLVFLLALLLALAVQCP